MQIEQRENSKPRPVIAVVSPFLDKRHGTERCVAEQIERLATEFEIHLYSNAVQDVDLSHIVWHRVPRLPGPHLLAYGWWFAANHVCRWWHRVTRRVVPVMVYSPGINCLDADVVSVHVVFGAYIDQAGTELEFRAHPVRFWPRLLHRRLYYALIVALERLLYAAQTHRTGLMTRPTLTAISAKAARNLERYGRTQPEIPVIVYGIDPERFHPAARHTLRAAARESIELRDEDFAVLLVGNDWRNKGLPCLMQTLAAMPGLPMQLLIAGNDDVAPYREAITRLGLQDRIRFLPMRPDVEFYYAAADVYAGPSLNDAFGLPPLEAMACGVPAIVSSQAGVSDVMQDGVDGFILRDPQDSAALAQMLGILYEDEVVRDRIGKSAAETARKYTWTRNAQQLGELFREVLRRKRQAVSPARLEAAAAVREGELL
jgi:glycosyltransferase involved in cell wall biosynthesis